MSRLVMPDGTVYDQAPPDMAEAIAETERRLGIRRADPRAESLRRLAADRDHQMRMEMQREAIDSDRRREREEGVRQVEQAIAGPLSGRRTPEHDAAVADAHDRIFDRDMTPAERRDAQETRRVLGQRKGHPDEAARMAQEVRDFLDTPAGRSTPHEAPWGDEADEVRRELYGPQPEAPDGPARERCDAPEPVRAPRRAPRPGEAGLPPSLRSRPQPAGPPALAPASVAQLSALADSGEDGDRRALQHAIARTLALLEVLTTDQRRRLAEGARQ